MSRAFLRLLLLLCLSISCARAENLVLVLSGQDAPYVEFAGSLRNALAGGNWKIAAQFGVDQPDPLPERTDLIVAAGTPALRQALQRHPATPILATLLPRSNYEKLLAEAGNRRHVSAIWLDQPAGRQALFIRHLLPGKNRIGMLVSPETRNQVQQLRQPFASAGLMLELEENDNERNLLTALNMLLPRVSLLFAIPDSTIYRRENIKSILITSYRHQRPVIAFSPAFVNAGALAALYSTPSQIARQTADLLHVSGSNLPAPAGPSQFAILINQNVAEAFNMNLPAEADIRHAMLADKEGR